MDNTTVNKVPDQMNICSTGSLFINNVTGEIFVLFYARDTRGFYAVSLKDGDAWDSCRATAEKSIEGLRYLGSGLKITVER